MDKTLAAQEIQILEIAKAICFNKTDFDSYKPSEISFVARAYEIYLSNPELSVGSAITDLKSFCHFYGLSDSLRDKLLSKIKEDAGIREVEKVTETTTVDPDIETKVRLNQEHQASLIETDNPHSVAKTVERVRKSWMENERRRLIFENASKVRQKEIEEKEKKNYIQTVAPKKESREKILQNTYDLAKIAMLAQGGKGLTYDQQEKIIDQIVYASESGAITIDNYNELNVVASLAIKDITKKETVYDDIDSLAQEKLKSIETDPYSDKAEIIDQKINKLDFDNNSSNKEFRQKLYLQNQDYDTIGTEAGKEIENATAKLSSAFPNAKLPLQNQDLLNQKAAEIEKAIRKTDATALNVNPTGLGARTSATLRETGGNSNINSTIVKLYSEGLTQKKLDELTADPKSELSLLFKRAPTLRKQIENGLKKYSQSPDGLKTTEELNSVGKVGNLVSHLPVSVQKALHPIDTATAYANKKIGQYAGRLILKNSNSALAQKVGGFILSDGLKAGAKKFADEVAKKAILSIAQKAGASAAKTAAILASESAIAAASAALGISTAGLSLIIEVAVYVGWKVISFGYDRFKELYKYIWDEDFDPKQFAAGVAIGGAAIASTFMVINNGLKGVVFATRVAVVSALGIIWLSIATIAVFLTLTFLTAPILSTLVQFDAEEKVEYSTGNDLPDTPLNCANMPWPFDGKYSINQGPRNTTCTHNGSIAESADFGTPLGTPIKSITSGVVSEAISSNEGYGNHVKVVATTDTGKTFTIIYGHFSSLKVSTGDKIGVGTVLGLSGNTGYSTGPHLHLGYIGIEYNSCPAGNHKINENCCDTVSCNQP